MPKVHLLSDGKEVVLGSEGELPDPEETPEEEVVLPDVILNPPSEIKKPAKVEISFGVDTKGETQDSEQDMKAKMQKRKTKIGFAEPEKDEESEKRKSQEEKDARKKLLFSRRQSRKSIFTSDDKEAEAEEYRQIKQAANQAKLRMIHKARMIGALGSKKGDLGRNLQNVIKNEEQIEYIYKQAEEVKSEMNSSLGVQMKIETLDILHMTMVEYKKQLGNDHEITKDLEDTIEDYEADLATQSLGRNSEQGYNPIQQVGRKVVSMARKSFMPMSRQNMERDNLARNKMFRGIAETGLTQEFKENFRVSYAGGKPP